MATPILPVEFESLDNGTMLTGTFDIKLARSFSSDSDSTYPTSSANASPEMNEDDETDLSKDDGECLGMPLCAPVAAMERSFSELSYDLQEDEHDEDDWEKLLEHLEKSDFPDVIAAPQKMKFADVKQALLKKPEKLKGSKNFTDAERKERNRIAAANSRTKRKMRLKELEVEVKRLLKIIHGKDERIATLENEVFLLGELLEKERSSDFYLEKTQDGKKKRKRIGRSKQPMLSNSARIGLLCCVSVCLAISPWDQDAQISYAFAMGGMQHSNAQSIAFVVGFIMIVACSVLLGRFQASESRNSYSVAANPASHKYILPLYWISAAVQRDVLLGNETVAESHVPKATLL
jgi:hypothetical protein